jgi:hypothetical protein
MIAGVLSLPDVPAWLVVNGEDFRFLPLPLQIEIRVLGHVQAQVIEEEKKMVLSAKDNINGPGRSHRKEID